MPKRYSLMKVEDDDAEGKTVTDKDAEITFVEVGVGSGIISIVLALHFTKAKFIAVDISQEVNITQEPFETAATVTPI